MGAIYESYTSTDLKRRVGVPRACPVCNIPACSPAVVMGRAGREVTAAAPTTTHAHDSAAGGREGTAKLCSRQVSQDAHAEHA